LRQPRGESALLRGYKIDNKVRYELKKMRKRNRYDKINRGRVPGKTRPSALIIEKNKDHPLEEVEGELKRIQNGSAEWGEPRAGNSLTTQIQRTALRADKRTAAEISRKKHQKK